jgi:predicted Zn finger-like uncharacterized protein
VILTCPACRTRYLVDEQDVSRPTGRTLRCASCGHTWHQVPPPQRQEREPSSRVAASRIEPALEMPPRPAPVPVPAPQRRPRRRRKGWLILSAVVALLALTILVAFVARSEVVATWPAVARLYALAGLSPRLELGKVVPARTANTVVIEGDITNAGSLAGDVPPLRVALRDPAEKETQFKIIDPPIAWLAPGETAHFKTSFDHPDEAATGVMVTFAPRADR